LGASRDYESVFELVPPFQLTSSWSRGGSSHTADAESGIVPEPHCRQVAADRELAGTSGLSLKAGHDAESVVA
jgi:hypothetical protein